MSEQPSIYKSEIPPERQEVNGHAIITTVARDANGSPLLSPLLSLHTGRTRYRVYCETCQEVLHEATNGPSRRIRWHTASPPECGCCGATDGNCTIGCDAVVNEALMLRAEAEERERIISWLRYFGEHEIADDVDALEHLTQRIEGGE